MDLPDFEPDVLSQPTRARIFALLTERREPTGTEEIATELGLHPNGVRRHLEHLTEAGLLNRSKHHRGRGRPGDHWSVAPGANPGGDRPTAYADLANWLIRAFPSDRGEVSQVERTGREIGRELAPPRKEDSAAAFREVMAALGFQPRLEPAEDVRIACSLGNCPYRDAAARNQELVCGLHRGITAGILDELDPDAELITFEPKDPYTAGCLVRAG
ncbi:MAG: helix-turn-helix domain-containing protein [Solirubrobacterales bacterium]|nr:helix-turn-helix domain-containing protein [Solirubrobacterales bacterium]